MDSETEKDKFPLPLSAYDFLQDIVDAGPDDLITLNELIGVGTVKYSDDPRMSAAVSAMTVPYTLIFGKQFMENTMHNMHDCVFVLWHELTHLVLDHFALDIREQFVEAGLGKDTNSVLAGNATHIIVDCQVNASCYHTLKDDKYTEWQQRAYPKHEMPHCFLRPDGDPEGEDLDPEYQKQLKYAHKKLYSKEGITNEELIDTLLPWFQENEEKLKEAIKDLIGNHKEMFDRAEQQSNQSSGSSMSDLLESVVKDMLEGEEDDKPSAGSGQEDDEAEGDQEGEGQSSDQESASNEQPSQQKSYGGPGNKRKGLVKRIADQIEQSKELARKLKRSYEPSPSSRIFAAIDSFSPKRTVRTVMPNFRDRRTAALDSVGMCPVFHRNPHRGSKVRVPCYVDVSGSQSHVLPYVYPVVSRLKRHVGDEVYVFSTYVSPTPIHKFNKGQYDGCGGTDFNPILEHILKNNFKKAIILTDGCAPHLNEDLVRRIKSQGVQIKVGWTEKNIRKEILEGIAMETFYVFGSADRR
jgi:hypothetical protein